MPAALATRTAPPIRTPKQAELVDLAREQLEQHPHFRGRAGALSIDQRGQTLYMYGQLPTFYLKQLAQETLLNLPGVQGVRNEVDVVNAHGISSVRN
jgi:hypothetical protein